MAFSEPPPAYGPAPGAPIPPRPGSGLAVAALVAGIVAAVVGWVPVLGLILGLAAVVLGIFGIRSASRTGAGRGLSIAGLVLGALAALTSILVTVAFGAALNSASTAGSAVSSAAPLSTSSPSVSSAAPSPSLSAAPSETSQSPAPSSTTPPIPAAVISDGTYLVGTDVQPGVYRATDTNGCYWERSKDASGDFDSIIANGNSSGQAIVEIAASDGVFQSNRCGDWTLAADSAPATPAISFGEGDFLVGADIAPGTYRNDGGDGCYWQRSRNALGAFDGIIANDNPNGPAVVEISSSDALFSSARCGTWTKVS